MSGRLCAFLLLCHLPHKKLPKAKGAAKTTIERQIGATDRAKDELVYDIYGLTEKEIGL